VPSPAAPERGRARLLRAANPAGGGGREPAPGKTREAPREARRKLPALAVSYSVNPRDNSGAPWPTGDVVLFADPAGTPVRFQWEGGSRRTRSTTVLKGFLPQRMRVRAQAPELDAAGEAWVPVKANCITTVRFAFR
jgi:hypothetical protein